MDPKTMTLHPRRTMVSYRTPEAKFVARMNKKLDKLKKFAERPITPKQ